jgi:hypothetical protein
VPEAEARNKEEACEFSIHTSYHCFQLTRLKHCGHSSFSPTPSINHSSSSEYHWP